MKFPEPARLVKTPQTVRAFRGSICNWPPASMMRSLHWNMIAGGGSLTLGQLVTPLPVPGMMTFIKRSGTSLVFQLPGMFQSMDAAPVQVAGGGDNNVTVV